MDDGKPRFSRRDMLGSVAGIGFASGVPAPLQAAPARGARPNILFIMADDLGYADLSCYGRRDYRTPVLDGLAASGVMLSQGYANSPVCSPTRAALITGAYQYRLPVGLPEPIGAPPALGLPSSAPTMPALFRELGYRTSLIGKWHLGYPPQNGPLRHGYERFFGIHEGGADYFIHKLASGDRRVGGLFDGERQVERPGYLTDLLADRAISEIGESVRASRPFFMSLHFTAPHWPWEGPQDEPLAHGLKDSQHWNGGSLTAYARMMKSLDDSVGRVLAALEQAGIADNTIVVFTSDNGGERFSDTWPFVGIKTELLEGGIRVPIILRWPPRIRPGSRSEQVMASMDFLPTLYAAAAGKPPADVPLDGVNLIDVLTGTAPPRPRKLFWRYKARGQQAVRDGDWKYLKIDGKQYLFNLVDDQRERANLKDEHRERFALMEADFAAWTATMLPYPEKSYSHDIRESTAD